MLKAKLNNFFIKIKLSSIVIIFIQNTSYKFERENRNDQVKFKSWPNIEYIRSTNLIYNILKYKNSLKISITVLFLSLTGLFSKKRHKMTK